MSEKDDYHLLLRSSAHNGDDDFIFNNLKTITLVKLLHLKDNSSF